MIRYHDRVRLLRDYTPRYKGQPPLTAGAEGLVVDVSLPENMVVLFPRPGSTRPGMPYNVSAADLELVKPRDAPYRITSHDESGRDNWPRIGDNARVTNGSYAGITGTVVKVSPWHDTATIAAHETGARCRVDWRHIELVMRPDDPYPIKIGDTVAVRRETRSSRGDLVGAGWYVDEMIVANVNGRQVPHLLQLYREDAPGALETVSSDRVVRVMHRPGPFLPGDIVRMHEGPSIARVEVESIPIGVDGTVRNIEPDGYLTVQFGGDPLWTCTPDMLELVARDDPTRAALDLEYKRIGQVLERAIDESHHVLPERSEKAGDADAVIRIDTGHVRRWIENQVAQINQLMPGDAHTMTDTNQESPAPEPYRSIRAADHVCYRDARIDTHEWIVSSVDEQSGICQLRRYVDRETETGKDRLDTLAHCDALMPLRITGEKADRTAQPFTRCRCGCEQFEQRVLVVVDAGKRVTIDGALPTLAETRAYHCAACDRPYPFTWASDRDGRDIAFT